MSSEEMRIELERFVNTGLQEGWTGWPLKVGACVERRLAGQWVCRSVRELAMPSRRPDLSGRNGRHVCLAALAVLTEEGFGREPDVCADGHGLLKS